MAKVINRCPVCGGKKLKRTGAPLTEAGRNMTKAGLALMTFGLSTLIAKPTVYKKCKECGAVFEIS